jgi:hypothetical protein
MPQAQLEGMDLHALSVDHRPRLTPVDLGLGSRLVMPGHGRRPTSPGSCRRTCTTRLIWGAETCAPCSSTSHCRTLRAVHAAWAARRGSASSRSRSARHAPQLSAGGATRPSSMSVERSASDQDVHSHFKRPQSGQFRSPRPTGRAGDQDPRPGRRSASSPATRRSASHRRRARRGRRLVSSGPRAPSLALGPDRSKPHGVQDVVVRCINGPRRFPETTKAVTRRHGRKPASSTDDLPQLA